MVPTLPGCFFYQEIMLSLESHCKGAGSETAANCQTYSKEQFGFLIGYRMVYFLCSQLTEASRESANTSYMCFLNSEKACNQVPQSIICEKRQESELFGSCAFRFRAAMVLWAFLCACSTWSLSFQWHSMSNSLPAIYPWSRYQHPPEVYKAFLQMTHPFLKSETSWWRCHIQVRVDKVIYLRHSHWWRLTGSKGFQATLFPPHQSAINCTHSHNNLQADMSTDCHALEWCEDQLLNVFIDFLIGILGIFGIVTLALLFPNWIYNKYIFRLCFYYHLKLPFSNHGSMIWCGVLVKGRPHHKALSFRWSSCLKCSLYWRYTRHGWFEADLRKC